MYTHVYHPVYNSLTAVRINYPQVQYTIYTEGNIIGCNSALLRHVYRNFFKALYVLNFVHNGQQNIQTGLQDSMESTHAFNDPCLKIQIFISYQLPNKDTHPFARCLQPSLQRLQGHYPMEISNGFKYTVQTSCCGTNIMMVFMGVEVLVLHWLITALCRHAVNNCWKRKKWNHTILRTELECDKQTQALTLLNSLPE